MIESIYFYSNHFNQELIWDLIEGRTNWYLTQVWFQFKSKKSLNPGNDVANNVFMIIILACFCGDKSKTDSAE